MWVRAVAAALAVWCASGAAVAAGYTEVWNPPESSGHVVARPAKQKPVVGKVKPGKGPGAEAKHATRAQHREPRIAAAGHQDKTAALGNGKKVAPKGAKGDVTQAGRSARPGVGKAKPKAVVTAQANKPHTPIVHARAEVARANLGQPARPHAVSVAAKSTVAKPVASHPNVNANAPVTSASFGGSAADASTNPATASSGSLPPIIH